MRVLAITTLLSAVLLGCASGSPRQTADPKLPAHVQSAEYSIGWPDLGRGDARFIRIDLGPDNFEQCQRLSPKFPFDSAATFAQDREQLVALAACLDAPGMRERRIVLVGHADARGADGYNAELGMKRAEAIRRILVDSGIAESRIEAWSAGEHGAVGALPEYDHGYDRRVDVLVEGGTHAP